MPYNNIPCPDTLMITNILVKPKSNKGLFIFTPDLFIQPCYIHPMDVSILANSKGDIKVSLLDDNQNPLFDLVLKCSQYDVKQSVDPEGEIPESVMNLYSQKEYSEVIYIGASITPLLLEYIQLEKTAYEYRQIQHSYFNFWKHTDKRNGFMQYMIKKINDILFRLNLDASDTDMAYHIWSMNHCILRSRLSFISSNDEEKEYCDSNNITNF